jgi:hypothetical protein
MTASAFIVGIDEYPGDTGLPSLGGAVADAIDFADWALDPGGGGIAEADLWLWAWPPPAKVTSRVSEYLPHAPKWFRGDPSKGPPTDANLTQSLFDGVGKARTGNVDRIYVFLAGHGIQVDRKIVTQGTEMCFIAADYTPDFSDGLVPCDSLLTALRNLGPAEIVLMLDCCRLSLNPTQSRPALGWPDYRGGSKYQGSTVGRSAGANQRAFEIVADGHKRGAFSHLVLLALRNLRIKDELTAGQLSDFVTERLPAVVAPEVQHPEIEFHPSSRRFTLVQGPAATKFPLTINFSARNRGKVAHIRDPATRAEETIADTPESWSGTLPMGFYSLEFDGEMTSIDIEMYDPEGTNVDA